MISYEGFHYEVCESFMRKYLHFYILIENIDLFSYISSMNWFPQVILELIENSLFGDIFLLGFSCGSRCYS